jgi:hypothetical protein
VSNLSVDATSLNPQYAMSERGENQNQLAGVSKSESERSERSERSQGPNKRKNKGTGGGWRPPGVGELSESKHKYACPQVRV